MRHHGADHIRIADARIPRQNLQPADGEALFSDYWTNFAKTGDPNGKGLAAWPAFDGTKPSVRRLGTAAEIRDRGMLPDFDSVAGR